MIYVNKLENRITFKIKAGFHLKLLTLEAMKLLGINKSKITKDENGENVPHLEIPEVILVHCNIMSSSYQQNLTSLHTFVPNKSFTQLLDITFKNFLFLKFLTQNFPILKYGLLVRILYR